ncbi:UNVERIFIED_CONTAM: hypothetical protein Sangu_0441000 [Sesamum angustifolium]|uniref:PSII 6.1 kDa protein n=1 Tax=Sesamum angustifolium TaxID=2727405 RepID=A0AAW2QU24_9LAMI
MATISACTSTSSVARAALVQKAPASRPAAVLGLPSMSKNMGKVRCSMEEKATREPANAGDGGFPDGGGVCGGDVQPSRHGSGRRENEHRRNWASIWAQQQSIGLDPIGRVRSDLGPLLCVHIRP